MVFIIFLKKGNLKSAELFITNITKYAKEKLINEENEMIIFSFVLCIIKNERMKFEESNAESLVKSNKEYLQTWSIYSKIFERYRMTDSLYCR